MERKESDISLLFTSYRNHLEQVQKFREEIENVVKSLEQRGREIVTELQIVHNAYGLLKVQQCCDQCRQIIEKYVKPEFKKLEKLFNFNPQIHYYEYHESWKHINQKLSFAVSLIIYLETGELATYEDVAATLGIPCKRDEGFHLILEDYLMGLLHMSSELSRLAVNSVVCGDYNRPFQISQFVTNLNVGFQLLNFKNDSLRRRFDALKYDVRKIEEVVYDLSVRGLTSKE